MIRPWCELEPGDLIASCAGPDWFVEAVLVKGGDVILSTSRPHDASIELFGAAVIVDGYVYETEIIRRAATRFSGTSVRPAGYVNDYVAATYGVGARRVVRNAGSQTGRYVHLERMRRS